MGGARWSAEYVHCLWIHQPGYLAAHYTHGVLWQAVSCWLGGTLLSSRGAAGLQSSRLMGLRVYQAIEGMDIVRVRDYGIHVVISYVKLSAHGNENAVVL